MPQSTEAVAETAKTTGCKVSGTTNGCRWLPSSRITTSLVDHTLPGKKPLVLVLQCSRSEHVPVQLERSCRRVVQWADYRVLLAIHEVQGRVDGAWQLERNYGDQFARRGSGAERSHQRAAGVRGAWCGAVVELGKLDQKRPLCRIERPFLFRLRLESQNLCVSGD